MLTEVFTCLSKGFAILKEEDAITAADRFYNEYSELNELINFGLMESIADKMNKTSLNEI